MPIKTGICIEAKVERTVKSDYLVITFIAQCHQTLADVTQWWIPKLFSENACTTTTIEHSNDGGQIGIV
jgi:hypothetical protein